LEADGVDDLALEPRQQLVATRDGVGRCRECGEERAAERGDRDGAKDAREPHEGPPWIFECRGKHVGARGCCRCRAALVPVFATTSAAGGRRAAQVWNCAFSTRSSRLCSGSNRMVWAMAR